MHYLNPRLGTLTLSRIATISHVIDEIAEVSTCSTPWIATKTLCHASVSEKLVWLEDKHELEEVEVNWYNFKQMPRISNHEARHTRVRSSSIRVMEHPEAGLSGYRCQTCHIMVLNGPLRWISNAGRGACRCWPSKKRSIAWRKEIINMLSMSDNMSDPFSLAIIDQDFH